MSQYLSHTELRCTPEERAALIELLADLRERPPQRVSSWGPHAFHGVGNTRGLRTRPAEIRGSLGFNMMFGAGLPVDQHTCGSACCLGGHVSLKMQGFDTHGNTFPLAALEAAAKYVSTYGSLGDNKPLDKLYYVEDIHSDAWDSITPQMAAESLERMLRTGDPDWPQTFELNGLGHLIDRDD